MSKATHEMERKISMDQELAEETSKIQGTIKQTLIAQIEKVVVEPETIIAIIVEKQDLAEVFDQLNLLVETESITPTQLATIVNPIVTQLIKQRQVDLIRLAVREYIPENAHFELALRENDIDVLDCLVQRVLFSSEYSSYDKQGFLNRLFRMAGGAITFGATYNNNSTLHYLLTQGADINYQMPTIGRDWVNGGYPTVIETVIADIACLPGFGSRWRWGDYSTLHRDIPTSHWQGIVMDRRCSKNSNRYIDTLEEFNHYFLERINRLIFLLESGAQWIPMKYTMEGRTIDIEELFDNFIAKIRTCKQLYPKFYPELEYAYGFLQIQIFNKHYAATKTYDLECHKKVTDAYEAAAQYKHPKAQASLLMQYLRMFLIAVDIKEGYCQGGIDTELFFKKMSEKIPGRIPKLLREMPPLEMLALNNSFLNLGNFIQYARYLQRSGIKEARETGEYLMKHIRSLDRSQLTPTAVLTLLEIEVEDGTVTDYKTALKMACNSYYDPHATEKDRKRIFALIQHCMMFFPREEYELENGFIYNLTRKKPDTPEKIQEKCFTLALEYLKIKDHESFESAQYWYEIANILGGTPAKTIPQNSIALKKSINSALEPFEKSRVADTHVSSNTGLLEENDDDVSKIVSSQWSLSSSSCSSSSSSSSWSSISSINFNSYYSSENRYPIFATVTTSTVENNNLDATHGNGLDKVS